jgi:hypothetical protein
MKKGILIGGLAVLLLVGLALAACDSGAISMDLKDYVKFTGNDAGYAWVEADGDGNFLDIPLVGGGGHHGDDDDDDDDEGDIGGLTPTFP